MDAATNSAAEMTDIDLEGCVDFLELLRRNNALGEAEEAANPTPAPVEPVRKPVWQCCRCGLQGFAHGVTHEMTFAATRREPVRHWGRCCRCGEVRVQPV